jgi:hypothetical protein
MMMCHNERSVLEKGQTNIRDVSIYIGIHQAFIGALVTLVCMAGVATTRLVLAKSKQLVLIRSRG